MERDTVDKGGTHASLRMLLVGAILLVSPMSQLAFSDEPPSSPSNVSLPAPIGGLQERRLETIQNHQAHIEDLQKKIADLQPKLNDLKQRVSEELPFVLSYLRRKTGLDPLPVTQDTPATDTPKRLLAFQILYHAYKTKQKTMSFYTLSLATHQKKLNEQMQDYQKPRMRVAPLTPDTAPPLELRDTDPSGQAITSSYLAAPPSPRQQQDPQPFVMPTLGPTVITYANPDYAKSDHNYGVAIYTDDHDPVVAPISGRVTFANTFGAFGKTVIIETDADDGDHQDSFFISGLKTLSVKPGMTIGQGRPLGTASSKQAPGTSVHLPKKGIIYIEKRRDTIALPPQEWLTPHAIKRMG